MRLIVQKARLSVLPMRAAIYRSVGGPDVIEVAEVPTPEPGLFEIRVRVQAASLNPADIAGWSGIFPGPPAGGYFGIGMDLAGVVDAAGPLTTWEPGTPVIGYIPGPVRPVRAQAEYAIVTAGAIAPAPAGVDPVHAATIPLNGLTASQSVELLGIQPGQTVLITGAGGAVGGYAVQLAKRRGATVIAIAPARDEEFLRGIGVDHFVPASDDPAGAVLEIAPGGVDAALDTTPLGGALVPALRDGGTVRPMPTPPWPGRHPARLPQISAHCNGQRARPRRVAGPRGTISMSSGGAIGYRQANAGRYLVTEGAVRFLR